jgi:hypothetical protein
MLENKESTMIEQRESVERGNQNQTMSESSIPTSTESISMNLRTVDSDGGVSEPAVDVAVAEKTIAMRSDLAHDWTQCFKLLDENGESYFNADELMMINDYKHPYMSDAMNLFFLPPDPNLFRIILDWKVSQKHPKISEETKLRLQQVKSILSMYPELGFRWSDSDEKEYLLRLYQVAGILRTSEPQVRKLVNSGKLECHRSSGNAGLYLFKPEWVRTYLETRP